MQNKIVSKKNYGSNNCNNTNTDNDNKNKNDSNCNRAPFHSQISVNKLSTSEDSSLTGTQTFDTKTLMGSDEVCSLFDSLF